MEFEKKFTLDFFELACKYVDWKFLSTQTYQAMKLAANNGHILLIK